MRAGNPVPDKYRVVIFAGADTGNETTETVLINRNKDITSVYSAVCGHW